RCSRFSSWPGAIGLRVRENRDAGIPSGHALGSQGRAVFRWTALDFVRRSTGGASYALLRTWSGGSAAERRRMLADEFGDGSRRVSGEIGNRTRDRHGLAAGTLIGGDGKRAVDHGRREAFPNAARSRNNVVIPANA